MFSSFLVLIVSLLSSLDVLQVFGSGLDCATRGYSLTPSRLVVKYRDPVSVTCVVCEPQDPEDSTVNFEKPLGDVSRNETTAIWTVQSMTLWDLEPICFYEIKGKQMLRNLPVTVYQPPQNVSISFVNHTGPMNESVEYTLQCSVLNVAPVENLVVTFFRGQTQLHNQTSTRRVKTPVTETFSQSYNIRKEDDGVQFWCEAKLELGLEGPQPPPVVRSGTFTASALYAPTLLVSVNPDPIQIAEGETLNLNCSAEGNPAPSYTWRHWSTPISFNGSVYTVPSVSSKNGGEYICIVENIMGTEDVKFNVRVQVTPIITIIIGVVCGVLLLAAALTVFCHYKRNRMGNYSLKDVFRLHTHHTPVPVKD